MHAIKLSSFLDSLPMPDVVSDIAMISGGTVLIVRLNLRILAR